jgi:hypothetical protein
VAKKIHNDASNIFSLEALRDCSEINRRSANRMNKFETIRFVLSNTEGKKSSNKK